MEKMIVDGMIKIREELHTGVAALVANSIKPVLMGVLSLLFLMTAFPAAAQNTSSSAVELAPQRLAVETIYLEQTPQIDGRLSPIAEMQWTPLSRPLWGSRTGGVEGFFGTGWNKKGLYIVALAPEASADRLMNAGRVPDTPLNLTLHLDVQQNAEAGYPGVYQIRFTPLTNEPEKMLYRNQGFLFNHRLGYGSQLNDPGLVIWGERTLSGIEPEGLKTRWSSFSGQQNLLPEFVKTGEGETREGMVVEIFIPWENVKQLEQPADSRVYLGLDLALPGQSGEWTANVSTERDNRGALKLLAPNEPPSRDFFRTHSLSLQANGDVFEKGDQIRLFYPAISSLRESVNFVFENRSNQEYKRVEGRWNSSKRGYAANIEVPDIEDGVYQVTVKTVAGQSLADKSVFVGTSKMRKTADRIKELRRQRKLLEERDTSWKTGQLARADWMLNQVDLETPLDLGMFKNRLKQVDNAAAILDSLQDGAKPKPAAVNYVRPGGFSADGQRGYVHFKAVNDGAARLVVEADQSKDWRVSPLIYGTFSEPVIFDRPIYDLLYGQLLRNPSFEWGHPTFERTLRQYVYRYDEIDEKSAERVREGKWVPLLTTNENKVAAPWIGIGKGDARFQISGVSFNTRQSQRISVYDSEDWGGVAQLTSLPTWRETEYHFKTYLRKAQNSSDAKVQFEVYHDGQTIHRQALNPITEEWKPFEISFDVSTADKEQNAYLIALKVEGEADIFVDQTNLFPADTVGGGLDPQSVRQISDLNTGWVRWPGGNYASSYHWREGVGPLTERTTRPNPTWIGLNSHYFGMDEYMKFNSLADLEPLITVNAGTGTPQEAARWVEYANGSVQTPMGQLRADNGHPDPYNVKYWNIGNELWGFWQAGYTTPAGYVNRYKNFTSEMYRTDSSISFISIGVGPYSLGTKRWTDMLLEEVNRHHDIIDFHAYVGVPDYLGLRDKESLRTLAAIPVAFEQGLMTFRKQADAMGKEQLDVIVGEYNNSTPGGLPDQWQEVGDLLTYAGWLHGFIRQGEYLVGANATEYSVFDPRSGEFGDMHPRYELFRTYSEKAGNEPVPARLETPVRQSLHHGGKDVRPIFNVPILDAVVLRDSTDGSLSVGLINRDLDQARSISLQLNDFAPEETATQYLIWDEGAIADTSDRSGNTRVTKRTIQTGNPFEVHLPPHSVSLITIPSGQNSE